VDSSLGIAIAGAAVALGLVCIGGGLAKIGEAMRANAIHDQRTLAYRLSMAERLTKIEDHIDRHATRLDDHDESIADLIAPGSDATLH
jgi:hypothetical protein